MTGKRSRIKKQSTSRTRPTFTERFINLCNYYRETEARYHNAKSQQERKHLLIALKEITTHARHLIADYTEPH